MLRKSNSAKQEELVDLDKAIAERKRYYREQEALIKEMVETGNSQLMGLTHDIMVARRELRDIKTDIRTAAQDKVLLNVDLANMQQQAAYFARVVIL